MSDPHNIVDASGKIVFRLVRITFTPGPWFNTDVSSYQYRKSHCEDKTVVRSSFLYNGISYTGKITSLYWISPQAIHSSGTIKA